MFGDEVSIPMKDTVATGGIDTRGSGSSYGGGRVPRSVMESGEIDILISLC